MHVEDLETAAGAVVHLRAEAAAAVTAGDREVVIEATSDRKPAQHRVTISSESKDATIFAHGQLDAEMVRLARYRHLLLILVSSFALGGAIKLQDGVDADFPDSLGEGGLCLRRVRAGICGCGVLLRWPRARLW